MLYVATVDALVDKANECVSHPDNHQAPEFPCDQHSSLCVVAHILSPLHVKEHTDAGSAQTTAIFASRTIIEQQISPA